MSAKVGLCPACEQHVTWVTLDNGMLRCNNCWHHVTVDEQQQLDKLNAELKALEEKRRAALAAYR